MIDPGTVIEGKYQVESSLGEGAMGEVYKAFDLIMERPVALKFLRADIGHDDSLRRRFESERKVLAALRSPHIAALYTSCEFRGQQGMVMEFVPGEDLERKILRQGPIPYELAIDYVRQALDGLAEAHRLGIIHRDLKPSNLMLDQKGQIKVMDFGIAKRLGGTSHTEAGGVVGTYLYMAPEQVNGKVGICSDVYGMGAVLYHLLAGRPPFLGETPYEVQTAHIYGTPADPRDFYPHIPQAVVTALMCALAKDPVYRYQDADAFSEALKAASTTIHTEDEQKDPGPAKRIDHIIRDRPTKAPDPLIENSYPSGSEHVSVSRNWLSRWSVVVATASLVVLLLLVVYLKSRADKDRRNYGQQASHVAEPSAQGPNPFSNSGGSTNIPEGGDSPASDPQPEEPEIAPAKVAHVPPPPPAQSQWKVTVTSGGSGAGTLSVPGGSKSLPAGAAAKFTMGGAACDLQVLSKGGALALVIKECKGRSYPWLGNSTEMELTSSGPGSYSFYVLKDRAFANIGGEITSVGAR
jgi:serine/threonine protein kinase